MMCMSVATTARQVIHSVLCAQAGFAPFLLVSHCSAHKGALASSAMATVPLFEQVVHMCGDVYGYIGASPKMVSVDGYVLCCHAAPLLNYLLLVGCPAESVHSALCMCSVLPS